MRDSSKYPKKSVAVSGLCDILRAARGFAKNAHPRLFSARRSAAQPRVRKFQAKTTVLLGWVLLAAMFCHACAKVGEPQPPIIYIPQPSQDLKCRQVADQAILSVSFPSLNTNGTPVNDLKTVEVFRVEAGLGRAASLTEEDFLKAGTRILSVSEAEFPRYQHDNRFVFSDPLPLREDAGIYSKERIYSVRFLNRRRQTAGFGNQVSLAAVPVPPPPVLLSPVISQDAVRLKWEPPAENLDGSKPARILGYNVYRAADSQSLPDKPLHPKPLQQPEFDDRDFEFDRTYTYVVSVVSSTKEPLVESLPSKILTVTPRDAFPPGAAQNLIAVAEEGAMILLWMPPADSDVAGYRVYRSERGATTKNLLDAGLIKTSSYRDLTAVAGSKYIYGVTAVDMHGNESKEALVEVDMP